MKTWKEYCEAVGLFPLAGAPKIKETWFAYNQGKVIECKSRQEAIMNSKMVDCKKDHTEFDAYWKNRTDLEMLATKAWFKDLREENDYLTIKVFDVLYNKAYDKAHSDGYDEIVNEFDNVVAFYNDIVKAQKNS